MRDFCLELSKIKGLKMLALQTKSSHFTLNQADKFVVNPSLKPAFLMFPVFQNLTSDIKFCVAVIV